MGPGFPRSCWVDHSVLREFLHVFLSEEDGVVAVPSHDLCVAPSGFALVVEVCEGVCFLGLLFAELRERQGTRRLGLLVVDLDDGTLLPHDGELVVLASIEHGFLFLGLGRLVGAAPVFVLEIFDAVHRHGGNLRELDPVEVERVSQGRGLVGGEHLRRPRGTAFVFGLSIGIHIRNLLRIIHVSLHSNCKFVSRFGRLWTLQRFSLMRAFVLALV